MADLYISNGTCYLAADIKSHEAFGPCGNDAAGRKACCQLGDQCLSNNACYNAEFGATYLAGCSDPDYAHPSCPDKAGLDDMPWTGLVYCTTGKTNEWAACAQSRKPKTLAKPDACSCPRDEASRLVAFEAGNVLDFVAQMPRQHGGSMVFQPGYVPTQAVTVITTVASGRPTSVTSTLSATTASSAVSGSGDGAGPSATMTGEPDGSGGGGGSGISKSATVGIAIGASVGGLILLGTLIFILLARRRRLKNTTAATDAATDHPTDTTPSAGEKPAASLADHAELAAPDGTPRHASGAAFGTTPQPSPMTPTSRFSMVPPSPSELGATSAAPAKPWTAPRQELVGSEVLGADGDALRRERHLTTLAELPG